MDTLLPKAEKGKSVRAAWNGLEEWAKQAQILQGINVHLARTAKGTIISFVPPRQEFKGAFFAFPAERSVRFSFGMVEGREAMIGGKPVTDDEAVLKISEGKFDEDGRSWLGVLIKHKDGKIDKKAEDAVTMIQRNTPLAGGAVGEHFHPVALMRQAKDGVRVFYQIEYFHLRVAWDGARKKLFVFPAA